MSDLSPRPLCAALLSLVLSSILEAQTVSATSVVYSDLVASAGVNRQSVPAGTAIGNHHLQVSGPLSNAELQVAFQGAPLSLHWRTTHACTGSGGGGGSSDSDLLCTVSGSEDGLQVLLRLDYTMFFTPPQGNAYGHARIVVDIDGDGSDEISIVSREVGGTREIPLTIGRTPRTIRFKTVAYAQGDFFYGAGAWAWLTANLRVLPMNRYTSSVVAATPCGDAPELALERTWSGFPEAVVPRLPRSGSAPSGTYLLIGPSVQNFPLPIPPMCSLATSPVAALRMTPAIGGAGEARVALRVPPALLPLDFVVQALHLDASAFRATVTRGYQVRVR
jgi:hypothetical protein